jgi:cytochrome b involved in lipid metabolism
MKKLFSLLAISIFAISLSGCSRDTDEPISPQAVSLFEEERESETEEGTSDLPVYSLTTIVEHNTRNDCWTVIDKTVVDVTGFFGKHPGGDVNLGKVCGIDATELFESVKKHDPNGYQKLKELQIGTLGSEESDTEEPEGN